MLSLLDEDTEARAWPGGGEVNQRIRIEPAAALAAAEVTASAIDDRGRAASYLGARAIGAPDGGAVAVACWLRALQPYIAAG